MQVERCTYFIPTNQIKTNESNPLDELTELDTPKQPIMSLEDFLREKGVKRYDDLTEEQKKEWNDYIMSIDIDSDDLPF